MMFTDYETKKALNKMREYKLNQAQVEHLGMTWFWFTANVRIIISILQCVTIFLSTYVNNIDDKVTILVSGTIWTLIVAGLIYTRYLMVNFRRNALKLYFGLIFGVNIGLNILAALTSGDASVITSATGSIVASLIILIPEMIYFRKRAHLFSVRPMKQHNRQANNAAETYPVANQNEHLQQSKNELKSKLDEATPENNALKHYNKSEFETLQVKYHELEKKYNDLLAQSAQDKETIRNLFEAIKKLSNE